MQENRAKEFGALSRRHGEGRGPHSRRLNASARQSVGTSGFSTARRRTDQRRDTLENRRATGGVIAQSFVLTLAEGRLSWIPYTSFPLSVPSERSPLNEAAVAAALHDAVVGIANPLLDAVCPIYRSGKRGEPELEASCVLTRIGARHFLLTAAHAVAHVPSEPLTIGGAKKIVDIGGEFYRTSPPPTGGSDLFDLAVFPLSSAQVAELGPSRFINLTEMDLNERTDYRPIVRSCYLPLGYPARKQPRLRDGEMLAIPMMPILHGADPRKYDELGFSPDTHLLLEFARRRMRRGTCEVTAPIPRGASGGGIWCIPRLASLAPGPARLVAILIEYHERHHQTLVGVRVGACLAMIAQRFPDLAPLIAGAHD